MSQDRCSGKTCSWSLYHCLLELSTPKEQRQKGRPKVLMSPRHCPAPGEALGRAWLSWEFRLQSCITETTGQGWPPEEVAPTWWLALMGPFFQEMEMNGRTVIGSGPWVSPCGKATSLPPNCFQFLWKAGHSLSRTTPEMVVVLKDNNLPP